MYRDLRGANASGVVCGFRGRNVDGYNLRSMSKIISSENGGKTAKMSDSATVESNQQQRYNPAEIEPKWQARWDADAALYAAEGHDRASRSTTAWRCCRIRAGSCTWGMCATTAIGDALARHMWMRGYNVLHPMGWDAFGLPAENAALKNNTPPREWTLANIAAMKRQMRRMGLSYDWATEVTTCLPDYYRWNQWFFLRMYERGLAYRKKSKVNWCPECATVLANEQVIDGDAGGMKTRSWSSATWSSGSCASRSMRRNCWTASTSWRAGRRRCARCSATGSAAAKDARWTSPSEGEAKAPGMREDSRLHDARRHDLWRDERAAGAGARLWQGLCRGGRCAGRADRGDAGGAAEGRARPAMWARSRSTACRRAISRSIRTAASACRSGWRTTSWRTTAPAPS